MVLHGDTRTLELSDLFQDFERNRATGLLRIKGNERVSAVYFRAGLLTLFSYEGRPKLMDVLVGAGLVSGEALEKAVRERRSKDHSIGAELVEQGAIEASDLEAIAVARIVSDACELLAERDGRFQFEQGPLPGGVFDPEEVRLRLGLTSGPLLLEAARRADHWPLIRRHVPSDSSYYTLQSEPSLEEGCDVELARSLLRRLDGTRNVEEALAPFVHRRFEAYELLSKFVAAGTVRRIGAEEILAHVNAFSPLDDARARALLEGALRDLPNHPTLLAKRVDMATARGDDDAAIAGLLCIAELAENAARHQDARKALAQAMELAPEDTGIAERRFRLAVRLSHYREAVEVGHCLAELYRSPGHHRHANEIFDELCELDPSARRLRRDWKRARARADKQAESLQSLELYGRRKMKRGELSVAREAFAAVLDLAPDRATARRALQELNRGDWSQRILQVTRAMRRPLQATALIVLVTLVSLEASARRAWSQADQRIAREGWVETGQYQQAADLLEAVRTRHLWSTIAHFDLPARIDHLRTLAGGAQGAGRGRP